MKRLLVILSWVVIAFSCFAEESNFKIVFKDYTFSDPNVKALALGICTWTDNDYECAVGGYLNFNFVSLLNDRLRLGTGFVVIPGDETKLEIRLDTSLTIKLFNYIEVGTYWCPFWGTMGKDDPFGLLLGYTF